MPKKSNKPLRKTNAKAPIDLSREIDAKTLTRAQEIAHSYTVLLEPHERLGFMASALEFPTVWADGKTEAACLKKMRYALTGAVAFMLYSGEAPPQPASDDRRDQQINIRLTSEEKALLENLAKRRGFRGISDLVRTAALSETRKAG